MLKTMLPVGSGLLGCFCFGGGDWLMLYGDTAHQGSLFRLTEVTALIGPSGGGEIGHVRRVYPEASPGVSDDNWREWFHPLWKAADKPQVHLLSKIAFQCPKQFRNLKAQKANNRPITLCSSISHDEEIQNIPLMWMPQLRQASWWMVIFVMVQRSI